MLYLDLFDESVLAPVEEDDPVQPPHLVKVLHSVHHVPGEPSTHHQNIEVTSEHWGYIRTLRLHQSIEVTSEHWGYIRALGVHQSIEATSEH